MNLKRNKPKGSRILLPLHVTDFYTVFSKLASKWVQDSQEEFNEYGAGLKDVYLCKWTKKVKLEDNRHLFCMKHVTSKRTVKVSGGSRLIKHLKKILKFVKGNCLPIAYYKVLAEFLNRKAKYLRIAFSCRCPPVMQGAGILGRKVKLRCFRLWKDQHEIFLFTRRTMHRNILKDEKEHKKCKVIGLVRGFFLQGEQKHGFQYPRV